VTVTADDGRPAGAYDEPEFVANDLGEMVRAGSLYADKCAECTTGVSCEDAGTCLFEG